MSTTNQPPLEPDLPDVENLDGHTLDELSDYLDRGETPPDPTIDDSPHCQIAIEGLRRLRSISATLLADEIRDEPAPTESWFAAILENLTFEAQAGRDIPVTHPSPKANLSVTEGAVRAIIRRAGDDLGGVIIGKTRLEGDVTVPGEPINVRVSASVFWGENIPELAALARDAILAALHLHTDLNVSGIDVTVTDVHVPAVDGS